MIAVSCHCTPQRNNICVSSLDDHVIQVRLITTYASIVRACHQLLQHIPH